MMVRQPHGATGVSAEEGRANRVGDCGSPHFRYRFVSSFQAMGRKPIHILPRLSGTSREEGRTFSPLPATPKMIPATATPALQNARTLKRARRRISRKNPRKKSDGPIL